MTCPACGVPSPDGRRFRLERGAPLATACTVCGAANGPAAKPVGSATRAP
jgi:hypothetical protein